MKKLSAAILGLAVLSSAFTSPALALGGCGPNMHRNGNGVCVPGGQNQNYCLRTTGHTATRMPDGRMVCMH